VTAALQELNVRIHPTNEHFAQWFAGIGYKEINPARPERFFRSDLAKTCCPKRPTSNGSQLVSPPLESRAFSSQLSRLSFGPRLDRQPALPLTARSTIVDLVGDLLTNGCQF